MFKRHYSFVLIILFLFTGVTGHTQGKKKSSVPKSKTTSMQKFEGYFDFFYDAKRDKIFLLIDKLNEEFLYVNSLAAGIGSNDIGLDRGQLGGAKVVKFTRVGPKILLVQPNYSYRAESDNPDERKAVEQAFAQSVIWGFKVDSELENGILVDATDFFMLDAHNVVGRLKGRKQGSYKLDKSRSAFYPSQIKAFPENVEFEATLTFTGTSQSGYIRSVTPSADAITVRQHHSFIKLPDDNYAKRKFDPRAGYYPLSYMDYATPIDVPIRQRFIYRHRLQKKDPSASRSEAIEPIIYYLDRGAPEPVRSALMEGARWWNQAFEAAGYINAFQVKLMPEDADPMDVRYNLIQWVHRSTRGWSYGSSVSDPRTGEIIKGHVSLGSLRVRQDFLIAVGLLSPYAGNDVPDTMKEMALARIRQLAAHEVGHTIGLSHNYTSSMDGRASVMDYPHPYVTINKEGKLDFSEAYDTKIGAWDKVSVAYGYQDFAENIDESKALAEILRKAYQDDGLSFLSDQDARPLGSAHPQAHLWDNGNNAAEELLRVLKVRQLALDRFSENNIIAGQPMATLEESLAPIYFFHRYQVEATAKVIGGLYYTYALRGDQQIPTKLVPPAEQTQALQALLKTINPSTLVLREELIKAIPPRPLGYRRSRETVKIRTGLTFDPISSAEAAADMSIGLLLRPERATRLVEYHGRNTSQPGLDYVLEQLLLATWKSAPLVGYAGEVRHAVNAVALKNLMYLVSDNEASEQARALAYAKLVELKDWAIKQAAKTGNTSEKASLQFAVFQIEQFENDPGEFKRMKALTPPDGSPIGSGPGFEN
jgi:Met-zincin/Domain of unknown function (DUF5117)